MCGCCDKRPRKCLTLKTHVDVMLQVLSRGRHRCDYNNVPPALPHQGAELRNSAMVANGAAAYRRHDAQCFPVGQLKRLHPTSHSRTDYGGGESVSQSPLKDQVFSIFLDQNPPFELRPKNGVSLRQKPQCGVPRLVSQPRRLEGISFADRARAERHSRG
jgi:hypothetical protein